MLSSKTATMMLQALNSKTVNMIHEDIIGNPVLSDMLVIKNFAKTYDVFYSQQHDIVYRVFVDKENKENKEDIFLTRVNYARIFYDDILLHLMENVIFSKQTIRKIERLLEK